MTVHDRADHFRVRHFLGARFDHQNRVFCAGKGEVNGALFLFCDGGIDDIFSVHAADDDRTRRPCPRNIGNGERHRRTDHGKRFRRDVGIDRKRGGNHHDVVIDSLREQRADGTVDKARDENGFIGRAALSLLESAGNFADGEHLFFIIHGKGEEIHALSRRVRHADRHADHRVPTAHEAGAVGLFRIFAGLHDEFSAGIVRFEYSVIFE